VKISLRTALILAILAIVLVGAVLAGTFMTRTLRAYINERAELELGAHSRAASLYVEQSLHSLEYRDADRIADRLGRVQELRVTILSKDGRVVGDSDVPTDTSWPTFDHENRPEFIAADRTGKGLAHRYSTTVERSMVYAAARFANDQVAGVVRVSRPVQEIEHALAILFASFLSGAVIILLLALLLATITSSYFMRTLRSMVAYAEGLAEGRRMTPWPSTTKELSGLKNSLQALSEKMEVAVRELADERDRFAAVLEGMTEAVIALSPDGRVTVINGAAIALLEPGPEPQGRTLLETVRAPALFSLIEQLLPGRRADTEFELNGLHPRTLLARAARLHSGACVLVLMDVTELRRLERVRRDFVSNVSHELRTPIAVVRANAETLADGALEDRDMAPKFLASILSNAERLSNLIADLLDIAKIEEGKFELHRERQNLSDALRRAATALETPATEKKQSVEIDAPEELDALVDLRAMDQILFNLLDNAVKYTEPGGRIIARARAENGFAIVEVEDNGPGIPEHHRARLFERFYRVDKGRSREMGGTGLGLAIVKHLVHAMGGEAGMRPAPIRGSIFFVRIPRAASTPSA